MRREENTQRVSLLIAIAIITITVMICTVPPWFVTVAEPVGAPPVATPQRKRGRHNSSEFNSLRYSHYTRTLRLMALYYGTHLDRVRQNFLFAARNELFRNFFFLLKTVCNVRFYILFRIRTRRARRYRSKQVSSV